MVSDQTEDALDVLEFADVPFSSSPDTSSQSGTMSSSPELSPEDSEWLERNILNWIERHPRESRWNESEKQILLQMLLELPTKQTAHFFDHFAKWLSEQSKGPQIAESLIERFDGFFKTILTLGLLKDLAFMTQFQSQTQNENSLSHCNLRAGIFVFQILHESHRFLEQTWKPCPEQEIARRLATWLRTMGSEDQDVLVQEVMPFWEKVDLAGLEFKHLSFEKLNAAHSIFSEQTWRFMQFHDCNLSYCNMQNSHMDELQFEKVDLAHSNLSQSSMVVKIRNSTITHGQWSDIKMTDSVIAHCDLSESNFSNAKLPQINLNHSFGNQINFEGTEMEAASLRNCRLEQSNFKNADLRQCIGTNADLHGSDFSEANMEGAIMNGCRGEHTNFFKVKLKESNFYNADLQDSNFSESDLTDVYLNNANLTKSVFNKAHMERTLLRSAVLEDCQLINSNLTSVDLTNALLSRTNLEKANMTGSVLKGARMEGINLSGALMVGVDLTGALLEKAMMTNVDFAGVKLTEARLRGAVLAGNDMSKVDLTRVDLREADLSRCLFEKVDLKHAQMTKANLSGTRMRGAFLNNAKLSGAKLAGADLRETDLRGTDLTEKELRAAHDQGALLQDALFYMKDNDYYCKIMQNALIFVKVPSKKQASLPQ